MHIKRFGFVLICALTAAAAGVMLYRHAAFAQDPAIDLYKSIHDKIANEGAEIAVTKVSVRRDLSAAELYALIPGSNISEVLAAPNPRAGVSPGEAEALRGEITRDFNDEIDLADFEVFTKMEVENTEIFANGSEDDSGFDLMVDLDVIDKILFGSEATEFSGAVPGGLPGTTEIEIGAGSSGSGSSDSGGALDSGGSGPGAGIDSGAGGTGSGAQFPLSPEDAATICPVNDSFNSAVQALRAEEQANAGSLAGVGSGAGGGSGSPTPEVEDKVQPLAPLTPEPAADWSRPAPCIGPICIQLEAKYKRESSYVAADNCIACHFEKINDSFKRTLDYNLVPSKATGNLIEGPKCKNALFSGPKWNFIMISQPILTPPNDDIVTKGDIIKNMREFYEKYYNNPGRCKAGAGGACKPDPNITTDAAGRALEQSPPNATLEQIANEIRRQTNALAQEAAQTLKDKDSGLENELEAQAGYYSALLEELEAMTGYFESFAEIFNKIGNSSANAPCQLLHSKPTCS